MSVTSPKYGTSTSITITIDSLADGSARESTAVDNSTTVYEDVLVTLTIPISSGTPGNIEAIYVYAYGSEDGTHFGDNATGSDAALTMRTPTNLKCVGGIQVTASGGLTWRTQPFSIARAFGGVLPRKWGIVVDNETGLAFGTGCTATFTGVNSQSV